MKVWSQNVLPNTNDFHFCDIFSKSLENQKSGYFKIILDKMQATTQQTMTVNGGRQIEFRNYRQTEFLIFV